jgi:hypothetical protein
MEEGSETFRHGEDPLADGYVGEDGVRQAGRGLRHALGVGSGCSEEGVLGHKLSEDGRLE